MYIKEIEIKGFRNFNNFRMEFKDGLNVIVGSNNSGKTNLLKAIYLLNNPDNISVHDFNKNTLKKLFKDGLFAKQPPEIDIKYTIYHGISESNPDDESIIKLLSFLGLDEIEEQKEASKSGEEYNLVAKIHMNFAMDSKNLPRFIENLQSVLTFEDYIESLNIMLKDFKWTFTNGSTSTLADKNEVTSIFKIDYIEAERNADAVYNETRRAINDYLKNERNTSSIHKMKQEIAGLVKANLECVTSSIDAIINKESNEIGLKNGNISISQDIRPNTSISESYVIDVKDTHADYTLPLSHNGVGYNNLINIYMLIKLVDMRQGKDFRILCLEEPEAHLHPAMQYKLFSYLKKIDAIDELKQQIFVTSHSPNITAVAGIDNMYMLGYQRNAVCCECIHCYLQNQFEGRQHSKKHLEKFLDVTRSDMLFADKIILVEGITEKLLLPIIMEKFGCPYEDEHISIVEIGGKNFNYFIDVYDKNPIHKKVLCITDKDYKSIFKSSNLESISFYKDFYPEHVKEFEKTYKDNIKFVFQKKIGRTFEDEIFIENFTDIEISKNLLKHVVCDTLCSFVDDNELSAKKWNENISNVHHSTRPFLEELINKFKDAWTQSPKDFDEYNKLFFGTLFSYYAAQKGKGSAALHILTDESVMDNIRLPEYICEGLTWLNS